MTTILLATLCLLTLTTSAHAECAWVLWLKRTVYVGPDGQPSGKPEITWHAQQGFETAEPCKQTLAAIIARVRKDPTSYSIGDAADDTGFLHNESKFVSFSHYACLPDTVDPRGPKGK